MRKQQRKSAYAACTRVFIYHFFGKKTIILVKKQQFSKILEEKQQFFQDLGRKTTNFPRSWKKNNKFSKISEKSTEILESVLRFVRENVQLPRSRTAKRFSSEILEGCASFYQ
jgi:hypothetical protein